ncbi:MAG: rRNA methyltransferase [Magnetovibrio sp.]|nr:rRNA methyltransferase [Magnetovibrio sp.]
MRTKTSCNITASPTIILVKPQLGENIGMCARAMWNCGVTKLRIVKPRDKWPSTSAKAAAAGANNVIGSVEVFESLEKAVGDLNVVFASSARPRCMTKSIITPWEAASELQASSLAGLKTGIMFGQESKGLNNDEIVIANKVIAVPLNPSFNSLNLAQAVFVICYEWRKLTNRIDSSELLISENPKLADKKQLIYLFKHLETELDSCGFFRVGEKRPSMIRNIRNILSRVRLTKKEVRTLRGIISSLVRFGGRTNNLEGE